MTQNLIELLTTLVQRPNLREVVRQGIIPLISNVASYMIIPANREKYHYGDYNYFIHEKDEDIYKQRSIRNSCLDLISSLIEVFGDDAVQTVLLIIESLLATPSQESDNQSTKSGSSGKSSMDEVNIFDQAYMSANKKHEWKRKEVAIFLLGSFAEDISMFRLRNPTYDLKKVVSSIITDINFDKA